MYLGFPIGVNSGKIVTWQPVIKYVQKRLSGWASKNLLIGGRVILIKSVLLVPSINYFSFFKAPSGIISCLESLFINFPWGWGVSDVDKKISRVSWDNIYRGLKAKGLGI